ncbi:serine hydrolase [Photobacterium sp. WH24]|uniref:serine hydrolase domain-containing protein n=1 Tax=Photobacterium sp. WH24 TaxID=2827237 RepID=UPI001C446EA1|nr:serine hydrolase domain-containing protein [Photobacterium sp. WH24]MBV7260983.1 serine hydrolase [Photobacterium sp. WH24]
MQKISRRGLLKSAVIAGVAGTTGAWWLHDTQTPEAALDEMFNDALTDLPAASIGAVLIKNGQMVWGRGFGYQNLENRVPATLDSIWPTLGSVSKLVTWIALMQLVEQNQVRLHDDVSDYLGFTLRNPHFPDTPITPYHLLTHSSSLSTRKMTSAPDSMADFFCKQDSVDLKTWVTTYLSPQGAQHDPALAFDPYQPGDFSQLTPDPIGVIAGYSSLNTMVAACLIEQVSRLSFEDYTQQHIFSPLGLKDIGWQKAELDQQKIITPYEAKNSPRAPIMAVFTQQMKDRGYLDRTAVTADDHKTYFAFNDCQYFSPLNAAALLGSSTNAFVTLMCACLPQDKTTPALLKRETLNSMWQVQRHDPRTGSTLGLGWFQFKSPRYGAFWGHDGGGPGILSRVMVDPETGDGLVLLINNFFVDFRKRAALIDQMMKTLERF